VIVYKGTRPTVDSYSVFFDNAKFNQTNMLSELRSRGVTHVYLVGVALDVCVAFSALHSAEEGFVTTVIEDACRGVSLDGIAEKKQLMREAGVQICNSDDVAKAVAEANAQNTVIPREQSASAPVMLDVLVAAKVVRRARLIAGFSALEQSGHGGKPSSSQSLLDQAGKAGKTLAELGAATGKVATMAAEQATLAAEQATLAAGKAYLAAGQAGLAAGQAGLAVGQASLAAGTNMLTKPNMLTKRCAQAVMRCAAQAAIVSRAAAAASGALHGSREQVCARKGTSFQQQGMEIAGEGP